MTQIENGESGLSVRTKLNTALTQLDAVSATQPYATRAAFIAATVPDDTKRTAFIVNGQSYAVIRDAAGPIVQTNGQTWRPDGDITPQHFGAVGDGVADDTVAVQTALGAGFPLNWGNLIYRITSPLVEAVAKVDWIGSGAVILYDGAYAQEAVKITCGLAVDHKVLGLTFDANQKANVAGKFVAATVSETIDQWPSFYASQIIARNAYRANTSFPDGDGFRVDGGFNHAEIDNIRVHDCYMATGAGILLSQGIFGITFGSNGARRCRNVRLSDYHIENVWSEDAAYKNDQDAVRIFQEMDERTSTCFVLDGTIKNVSNRAVKLHSGVNAMVDRLYRELDAAVIPQSGAFQNADIDAQQAPATVTNVRVHYKGAWHETVVQAYVDQSEQYRYGGALVDNISADVEDAAGSFIRMVHLTHDQEVGEATVANASVSNLVATGQISHFLSARTQSSASEMRIAVSNCVADVSVSGFLLAGTDGDGVVSITGSNIVNTGSSVPLAGPSSASGVSGNGRAVFVSGAVGFSGGLPMLTPTKEAIGVNGPPEVGPVDIHANAIGTQRVRLRGATNISTEESYVGWFEWFHQSLAKRLGYVGFGGGSDQNLTIENGSTSGDMVFRLNNERLRISRSSGIVLSNGPQIHVTTGTPEGTVSAPAGSIALSTGGGAGTTLYIKESGTGNTGWVAK
jgi:hypothetical protein